MVYTEQFQTNMLAKSNVIWTSAMLLAFTTSVGLAAEPLTYYGFDKASHSAAAQAGLEEIFSGRLFHDAAPVAVVSGSGKNLGYKPFVIKTI